MKVYIIIRSVIAIIIVVLLIIIKKKSNKLDSKKIIEEMNFDSANAQLFGLNNNYNEDLDKTQIININDDELSGIMNIHYPEDENLPKLNDKKE